LKIIRRGDLEKAEICEGDHTLIIAASGVGQKTCAQERITEEHFRGGDTIIICPNAKNNVEGGFCQFPITAKYHLKQLKYQQEKPQQIPIKYYHPYTPNFPTKKIYNCNIFTLDIKNLDRFTNSFIFESTTETTSISILNNAITKLKNNEGIVDLLREIQIKSKSKFKKQDFVFEGVPTSININTILNRYSIFKYNPVFMPSNFGYNLDMLKILRDNKHYHVFDNRFINDSKLKDLTTLYILNEIRKLKPKIKNNVVVVLDELKSFCPNNAMHEYKKILNRLIAELISTLRSLGISFISSSQIYGDIDQSVAQSFNELLIGKTSALRDLYEISRVVGLDSSARKEIMELDYNEFILLSNEAFREMTPLTIHLPRHAHQEQGQVFDRMCEQYCPDKMKSHKDIIKNITKLWKEQLKSSKKEDTTKN